MKKHQKTHEEIARKILSEMDRQQRIKDAPSMPPQYIIGTKYPEKNANNVEAMIERFAKIVGFMAERTKTQGRKLDAKFINTVNGRVQVQKETFIPGTSRKGSSDMKLLIPNIGFVACEIKFGKDTQRKDQKTYQQDIERNGGTYIIVKSFADFLKWYVSKLGRPTSMVEAMVKLQMI